MDQSIYREMQAAAERARPFSDGPAWQTLSCMEDELDALLPPVLHRAFSACATSSATPLPSTAKPASGSDCTAACC